MSLFASLQSGYTTCSPLSVKLGDRYIPTRAGSNWSINFHHANVCVLYFHNLKTAFLDFLALDLYLVYVLLICRRIVGHRVRINEPRMRVQTQERVTPAF